MKKQTQTQPLGIVQVSWSLSLLMPLAKAHQLQMLLTEARKYDIDGYAVREKFAHIQVYEVPSVALHPASAPLYDATMLSSDEFTEWRDAVRAGLEEDKASNASDVVTPELWKSLRGGV
jgi:hypothetical protein